MYTVFVFLHVLSAAFWISLIPVMMLLGKMLDRVKGTPAELTIMRTIIGMGMLLGNLGGIGVLITGPALVGVAHYPWFPFGSEDWLAYKQVIYVIILLINFAVMIPLSKKVRKQLAEEMSGAGKGPGASDSLRALYKKTGTVGMIMSLLVLTNFILGIIGKRGF
jgi:hypothetical protein